MYMAKMSTMDYSSDKICLTKEIAQKALCHLFYKYTLRPYVIEEEEFDFDKNKILQQINTTVINGNYKLASNLIIKSDIEDIYSYSITKVNPLKDILVKPLDQKYFDDYFKKHTFK